MNRKIVVIGSCNTDMVINMERLPLPGETLLGGTFFMNPGGKGANQAVAAARLGGKVIFIAKVGNDPFGIRSVDQYKAEGIGTKHVVVDREHPSGVALILVDAHGENSIAVASGANAHLLPADIDEARAAIEEGDIVLMHDIYDFTADLCEILVPKLVEKGFRIVSVSEMYEAYGNELKAGQVYYSVDFAEGNTLVVEPGAYKVKTKGSVLNIRTEPVSGAESLAKVPNGTPITVIDCIEGWAKVEYNSVVGWVNTAYIEAVAN